MFALLSESFAKLGSFKLGSVRAAHQNATLHPVHVSGWMTNGMGHSSGPSRGAAHVMKQGEECLVGDWIFIVQGPSFWKLQLTPPLTSD